MTDDTSPPVVSSTDALGDQPQPTSPWRRVVRGIAEHRVASVVGVAALLVGGVGIAQQLDSGVAADRVVSGSAPEAPRLTAQGNETIYRIDPSLSEARYEIGERMFGAEASTATGSTAAIAGDVALDPANPSAARVGEIVIDVEQLQSDSALRDSRIRSDFLESSQYQLVRFTTTSVEGLPDRIDEDTAYDVELTGDLEIRSVTREVAWSGTGRLVGDELRIDVSTTVQLTDFDMEPISIIGLLSTDDEVALTLDATAVDVTSREVSADLVALDDAAAKSEVPGDSPSYSRDVQPILTEHCAACHNTGTIGADVMALDTAADAARFADGIALATRTRFMPPWPASDQGIELRHTRTLPEDDIATLAGWAEAGAPLDVDGDTELVAPEPDPELQIRVDQRLTMTEAYLGDGTKANDYRCIIFDPGFTEPTYVTGYSFVPGEPEVVHHGLTYRVDAAQREATLARSGVDGRTGWECGLGNPGLSGRQGGRGALFAGWVPGQRPLNFEDNEGFLFQPGELIVTQIHYHYSDKLLADRSSLLLQTEPFSLEMRELVVTNPTGPVELPCPPDRSEGPLCDRAAALTSLQTTYGPEAATLANALNNVCPGGATSDPTTGNGSTTCTSRIRYNGTIVDVLGHMHEIGKSFRMTLNAGTDREVVLLDIPNWNFDWQLNYQPVEPVRVQRGDTLQISCSWDRSLKYDPEPRYLVFAEGTEDEMCFSTYTVLPDRP